MLLLAPVSVMHVACGETGAGGSLPGAGVGQQMLAPACQKMHARHRQLKAGPHQVLLRSGAGTKGVARGNVLEWPLLQAGCWPPEKLVGAGHSKAARGRGVSQVLSSAHPG